MDSVTSMSKRAAFALGGSSAFGGFPMALRVGDTLYIGSQHKASSGLATEADIAARTHSAFSSLVTTLEAAGLTMSDLMKLHTYYVFNGEGPDVTGFWERMTDVRLRYLANPGPAATALRVAGSPTRGELITIDGIATFSQARTRLMPAHAWDWSIPTPFSQGWKVGKKVYVGGQVSADRKGKAVAAWDAEQQTRNTLEYIRHVLLEAGGSWSDVVSLKVAYRHDGRDLEARELLAKILSIVRESLPQPGPALTCIGVDLIYEGLVLEIDAVAVLGEKRQDITASGSDNWVSVPGFAAGTSVGDEVYIGGTSAPGAASLVAQAEASMERMLRVLASADGDADELVKLNVFYRGEDHTDSDEVKQIARIAGEYLQERRPVLSIIRVPGLPHDGQRVQVDGVAVRALV
ncbi:MAG: hypothetical protein K0Q43_386 [Ramlibacter sp.]|nr:hypothetical protein [Ramlibacter sp.]